jgi:hypothetical protein
MHHRQLHVIQRFLTFVGCLWVANSKIGLNSADFWDIDTIA